MGTITILFVDQVGSTLQLSKLGDDSAVEIADQLQGIVSRHLEQHRGVFHKHTGDGFMASFESCIDAVECALSLQATTSTFNAGLPFERRVVLRMGLHTGEPLAHPTGLVGAAVVVAARLCDQAGAGQVLVSDVVRAILEPRRTFGLTPVGARRLKGFSEPMLCYLVRGPEQDSSPSLPPELARDRDTPFVGRAVELDRLRVAFVEAAEGTAVALVLAGESGSGKTRLMTEFAAEAHRQGARLVYATGAGAVEMLAGDLSSGDAQRDPLIAIVDDVSDSGTIRDIVRLLRAVPSERVLVIVATRLDGLDEQILGAPVVPLAGLAADDVRYLLEVGGGRGDVDARARELVAVAHGTPGAVRAELAELNEATIRDDLRDAIDQATTIQEDEERSFAAITAGLLALRSDQGVGRGAAPGDTAPYKGLMAYGPDDSEWFCGRDELTAQLVAHLAISRFIAVTGSSGSGKSSLVRAGLIAALQAGAVDGSPSWPIMLFTPHGRPLAELADQLVAHAGGDSPSVLADRIKTRPTLLADIATRSMEDRPDGSRLIIVIDQFEEVFTHCRNDEERTAFFDALVHAARIPDGPATIVVVLRGDYYGHCAEHPELAQAVATSHVLIGPMSPSEIRLAIEEPARRAGLHVDPELADRAIDDASGEPGMLPLLSTAMLETWKRRQGGQLTLDAYLATGGVKGAIARLAESVYERLSVEQRGALRAMLLRLAELGEDGDDVRRRASLDELVTTPTHQQVLDALVSHRLVTVDAGRAEVAHEALLREWPRLRTWLEEDRAGRRLHRQLTIDARAWEDAGRADDVLYRGVRLDAALEWAEGRADDLHPSEQAFLEDSRSARARELSSSRRAARRFRWLAAALGVLLVAALAGGVLAQVQRHSEARARALANQSAALTLALQSTSLQDENPALALALAAESAARTPTPLPAATKALFDAGVAFGRRGLQQLDEPIVGHPGPVFGVVFSPDDALLASSGRDGIIRLWDPRTRALVGELRGHECVNENQCNVSTVAFSPDGRLLASAGDDGTVRLWDVAARTAKGPPLRAHDGGAYGVAFSPDGKVLASSGANGGLRLWDVATGRSLRALEGHDPAKAVWAVAFSPDGTRLASAGEDKTVRLWDPASGEEVGQPLLGHTDQVQGVAFNPAGTLLASSGSLEDHTVRLWDPTTGQPVGTPLAGHTLGIWGVAFDPSGTLLASGSEDGTVRLWDVAQGVELGPPAVGHLKTVFGIDFSADGRMLASSGADGTIWLWAVHDPRTQVLRPHPGAIFGVGFAVDGTALAAAGEKGTVQLWDVTTGARKGDPLVGHEPENVSAAIFSPDGKTMASASDDGTVRLWDADTGREAAPPLDFGAPAFGLAFDAHGSRLAAVGDGGRVTVWDTATWRIAADYKGHEGGVWSVAFSPDDTLLATGGADETARLWDTATGAAVHEFPVKGGTVNAVRFSPDGGALATGSDDGVVRLWDVRTHELRRALMGHTEPVVSLTFDPQSDVLVSTGHDQTVRLWDIETGAAITAAVAGHQGPVWSLALDPTRKFLASAGADGAVFLWDWVVDTKTACELAAPYVTAEQVEEYLQPTSATPTCALKA
jgi:WD40 repeat protein/class 3 adenylate cyclase/tRNA A37 threonylcarbamoyladenosine biosynthesis protein TsaE